MTGFCELDNNSSGFVNGREILDSVSTQSAF